MVANTQWRISSVYVSKKHNKATNVVLERVDAKGTIYLNLSQLGNPENPESLVGVELTLVGPNAMFATVEDNPKLKKPEPPSEASLEEQIAALKAKKMELYGN